MNLYGYVGNDPINSWDPYGLIEWVGERAQKAKEEMQKTTEGRGTIARCEKAEAKTGKTITVYEGEKGKYFSRTNSVTLPSGRYLPHYAIRTSIDSPANIPATFGEIANHELIHAAQHIEANLGDLIGKKDKRWKDKAEKEACESTNRMRKETGRPPREQYKTYPLK